MSENQVAFPVPKIVIGSSYCRLLYPSLTQLEALRGVATFSHEYWMRRRVRRGQPPARPEKKIQQIDLIIPEGGGIYLFPTGLLPSFKGTLAFNCEELSIQDRRTFPGFLTTPDDWEPFDGYELRYYQRDAAVQAVLGGSGIISLPTGSGKSITTGAIIAKVSPTVRTLVMVPTLELLVQTAEVLSDLFGETVGKVGGRYTEVDHRITVATPMKLKNWLKKMGYGENDSFDFWQMVLVDECHHVAYSYDCQKKTVWYTLLMRADAYYKIGLSATVPSEGTANRILLESATGPVLYHKSTAELIEEGYLSDAEVEMRVVHHDTRINDWPMARKFNLHSKKRNAAVVAAVYEELKLGRSCLVIVELVDTHGAVLSDLIPEAQYITGVSSESARSEALSEFKANGGCLIGTIFGEGVDIPALDTVVLASGGKSSRLLIQRIGRALRKAPGKGKAKIIDFYDDDDLGILSRHSSQRKAIFETQGFEVRIVK